MSRNIFITLEGGEGGGKSTQATELVRRLRGLGLEVLATREPGGSPGAEAIRQLLVNGEIDRWSPMTETLLMYAARRDHIERTIAPALARGATIVCDRFLDSTRAYQGAGGGVAMPLIDALEAFTLAEICPDLTLIFDLPPEVGLLRAAGRSGSEARFEGKELAFHRRLRQRFLDIAAAEPGRCHVIDASDLADVVADKVWTVVRAAMTSA